MAQAENKGAPFPVTSWTLVDRAATDQTAHSALNELLKRYMPALLAHVKWRYRLEPAEAEDILQGFIAARFVEKNALSAADRDRGKFRTFLCTCIDNYTRNHLRSRGAAKRAPEQAIGFEPGSSGDVGGDPTPDTAFDVAWARDLLGHALSRMEAECSANGREDLWKIFDQRIRRPILEGVEPVPYDKLVAELGLPSPVQASNLLMTAKRMFQRLLREEVAQYAEGEENVDAEINDLLQILAQARA